MCILRTIPFLLILLMGSRSASGQFDRCEVVNYAISTDHFKEFIERIACDSTIVLFDPEGRGTPCSARPVGCYKFEMSYDTIYDKLSPNRYDRGVSQYLVVLTGVHTEGRKIAIGFWKPSNNQSRMPGLGQPNGTIRTVGACGGWAGSSLCSSS